MDNKLGTILKEARDAKGLSLDALSAMSGVSRGYISYLERGTGPRGLPISPNPLKLKALGKALGIPYPLLMDAASYGPDGDPAMDYLQSTAAKLNSSRREELIKLAEHFLWLQKNEKKQ